MTLTFNPCDGHDPYTSKNQGQVSLRSKDKLKTNGQTDTIDRLAFPASAVDSNAGVQSQSVPLSFQNCRVHFSYFARVQHYATVIDNSLRHSSMLVSAILV